MLFNSIDFAIFLPIVFVLYWFVINKNLKWQNAFIVVTSYVFYGWWDWRFLSLITFPGQLQALFIPGHKCQIDFDDAGQPTKPLEPFPTGAFIGRFQGNGQTVLLPVTWLEASGRCQGRVDGRAVRPKLIASTATIKQAREQMRSLFLRDVRVFPPQGLNVEDTFSVCSAHPVTDTRAGATSVWQPSGAGSSSRLFGCTWPTCRRARRCLQSTARPSTRG